MWFLLEVHLKTGGLRGLDQALGPDMDRSSLFYLVSAKATKRAALLAALEESQMHVVYALRPLFPMRSPPFSA